MQAAVDGPLGCPAGCDEAFDGVHQAMVQGDCIGEGTSRSTVPRLEDGDEVRHPISRSSQPLQKHDRRKPDGMVVSRAKWSLSRHLGTRVSAVKADILKR